MKSCGIFSVELCFKSSKGSFHYSFFSFCHLPFSFCGIDGTTLKTLLLMNMIFGFIEIRNKNGPPKDTLGWFRTIEIFMWSNVKVIWTYLNYNCIGLSKGIVLIANVYLRLLCSHSLRFFFTNNYWYTTYERGLNHTSVLL